MVVLMTQVTHLYVFDLLFVCVSRCECSCLFLLSYIHLIKLVNIFFHDKNGLILLDVFAQRHDLTCRAAVGSLSVEPQRPLVGAF